ncbi:uncharacterized protein TRAVEDRAFT_72697 [Trametes versicolor FP-101664 SS1]|uniref:uncharacterized protein n=1 Tax=Trametes versicolor (strain FP-101664) TaxID=717944 RepID=UPI00046222BF|nr:uncharacterized protein TRAVEDRAFT_72697 [Trametes versicolor FP-101664 SS1]EIW57668.1 hypothetical protein TRAVEDRAFT_72697 [Trametes versicolor FP-101664 SS1]
MAFNNLFGAKPAGQTGGSLFGQSTTQPQGGLFGNNQQQPQQQPQAGAFGSFGQPQGQNQTQNTNPLFGSTLGQNPQQQQQQQPQQGSSLFGSTFGQPQQQQGQQQQPQQPTGGLFGQTAGQQQQNAGGLFGQQQQQPQQKPLFGTGAGSLFGSTPQNQQGQQQPQQQQQQQAPFGSIGTLGQSSNTGGFGGQGGQQSLFGSTAPQQTGGSLWGKPATQPQQFQQQQQQQQSAPLFTKSTKFNDLPDELKRTFENIDSFVQGRVQICNDLKQRKLGDEAIKGQEEIRNVHKELTGAISVLTADVQHTKDLKHKVEQTVQDTIVATRIVEGFRNPQQHGQYLKTYANFPLEFFNRVTEQMRERLRWYKATIEVRMLVTLASRPSSLRLQNIERKLSSAASQPQHTPQAIVSTLEAQHATFMALATKTAALDAELQKLRTLYTQLWRAKTGSMRDPFNELDRGSDVGALGLESLSSAK